jgi:N-acetylglucosamine kinase-like BadF-type ATPase
VTGYFLGIDIGGTKSHALVADDRGRALALVQGGPGNHEDVGYTGLTETLDLITDRALATAVLTRDQIAGAGFGIAGYDWPSQRAPTLAAIKTLNLPNVPFELVNDTIIGMLAGSPAGWGLGLVAGTRCNCWGWDAQHRVGRMTGLGLRMGEAAGAEELVQKAIEAVALEWTRRGPSTLLSSRLAGLVGARDAAELLEGLTLGHYQLGPAAAPHVFQVAADGDIVAHELVLWAARGLASMAAGVIRQLQLEQRQFKVVLIGSFYDGSPLLVETITRTVQELVPGADLVRLGVPPVVGGVLLGVAQAGLNPAACYDDLIRSTTDLGAA